MSAPTTGANRSGPAVRPPARQVLTAGLGAVLALGLIGALATWTGQPLLLGSFGASCVLLFGFPDGPFSQPRNVIGGHVLASAIGLAGLSLLGPHWWAMAISAACALMAMLLTRTVHPPAGSNPVIVFLSQPTWSFLLLPTLIGAVTLMLIARLYRRLSIPTAKRP
ncbi:MAG TPA: HPP family protein [Burkholderiaceae bacterium]